VGDVSSTLQSQRGFLTGLWRTDTRVGVSDVAGRVFMNPSFALREAPWQTIRVNATLQA
jgi:hypothetical protein